MFDALRSLLDQSLIFRSDGQDSTPRFAMLETLREFGREELTMTNEQVVLRRHAEWFAGQASPPSHEDWTRPFGSQAFALPGEADNLRSALDGTIECGEVGLAAQLVWTLLPFWKQHGLISEARAAIDQLLETPHGLPIDVRAGLTRMSVELAWFQTEPYRAFALAQSALRMYEEIGSPVGIASGLQQLGSVCKCIDQAAAPVYYQRALHIYRELGDEYAVVWTLINLGRGWIGVDDEASAKSAYQEAYARVLAFPMPNSEDSTAWTFLRASATFSLGWMAFFDGELHEAERLGVDALSMFVAIGDGYGESTTLRILGRIARLRGDLQLAAERLGPSYRIVRFLGTRHAESYCLAEIAAIAVARNDPIRAARLLGQEATIREETHITNTVDERAVREDAERLSISVLGHDRYDAAFAEGRALSSIAAYEEAVQVVESMPRAGNGVSSLTSREVEVLRLIAEGHTNREIADSLFVSRRTVDGHVLSILSKLGAGSRRAAVVPARARGLLMA